MAVVENRSYSRCCRQTSLETEMNASGQTRSVSCRRRRSCVGFANEPVSRSQRTPPPRRLNTQVPAQPPARPAVVHGAVQSIRSGTQRRSWRSTNGRACCGISCMMLKLYGLRCRPMCRMSRKPSVVIIPTLTPRRSRIVLVPTVVPCNRPETSEAPIPGPPTNLAHALQNRHRWIRGRRRQLVDINVGRPFVV